eukprot:869576-Amphidinium_carterae.1
MGHIEVQWMRSHLTAQQAADADLPAGYQRYLAGNAEADLLAGRFSLSLRPLNSSPNPETAAAVAAPLFTETAEPGSAISESLALLHSSDVRVDDAPMDQRVPEGMPPVAQPDAVPDIDIPDAAAPEEREYRVGDHLCTITDGGICMTCRHCRRFVTSYKGTWRNLGTLRKQPCKPKKPKKGKAGKAPQQQKGG